MKIMTLRKVISGLVCGALCVPWFILYVISPEEKPHFSDKSKVRHELLVLQKLDPGQKRPVFSPMRNRNNTKTVKHSDRNLTHLQDSKELVDFRKFKQNNFGRQHLVEDINEQMLRDELPLFAPDWNCNDTYSTYQTDSYCLPHHDVTHYFTRVANRYCLKEGTAHIIKNGTDCYCKPKWYGHFCSMPKAAHNSEYPRDTYAYNVANPPRRLINAFPFTQEFHLLETRLHEYESVVDLYIILESNYTAAGLPRKRLLLDRLETGYLKEYQYKILYVPLGYFPRKAQYNGWIIDALLRDHIADEGLKRIKNLQESDVIVLNDADELPVREALLFLKLHRGYPEPVGFYLVHNVYGFYWVGNDKLSHAFGACSIGMLLHFFHWKLYRLRSATAEMTHNKHDLEHFKFYHGGTVSEWSFGKKATITPGGWHCSWCFSPEGIKIKLEGAHWSDLPRWGAYPSKTTVSYIRNLTIQGLWFDDRTALLPAPPRTDDWFAPKYLKSHLEEYKYLLMNSGGEHVKSKTERVRFDRPIVDEQHIQNNRKQFKNVTNDTNSNIVIEKSDYVKSVVNKTVLIGET